MFNVYINVLNMLVVSGLSRSQYEIIRSTSDKKLFPCYSILQKVKKDAYPSQESYRLTDTSAEINLQDLLDHTTVRLLEYLKEVVETLSQSECSTLELICKWGCDGSQQAQFKQKFENQEDSDSNIFQSSLVPLQLVCGTDKNKIIWQNPTPSSPRYCRPIRIKFSKESADITRQEIDYIQSQISNLTETRIGESKTVKHTMLFTMIDAKVCNAATHTTSTMRCYICGATSKEFNDLKKAKEREVNSSTFQFGLSILHARIRFFESVLHLSYKLEIKKWQLRGEEDKNAVKLRKELIQKSFKERLGLIVDVPKAGFGTTNDGNSSRRFFADPELSAEITGVNLQLIYRFKVILEALASGHRIDTNKFAAYSMDTAKLYVAEYPWHPMTPTLHKILIHGAMVIQHFLLPIGQLSEEAAEARNKHFRSYRFSYSRKFSREACNRDVLNRLLLTSDPLLTGLRRTPRKASKPFLKETLDLLQALEPTSTEKEGKTQGIPLSLEADESSDNESWETSDDE